MITTSLFLVLTQAEEREDEQDHDNQTDEVNQSIHVHQSIHVPLREVTSQATQKLNCRKELMFPDRSS
jgi:hypothetical protein